MDAEDNGKGGGIGEKQPASGRQHGLLIETLALLPPMAIIDEARLAEEFGVTSRTIRRMVSRFELPPPISLAGRSVWIAGRVLNHLDAAAERTQQLADKQAKQLRDLECRD